MPEFPDPFFIIGLPRSGTAWVSVALTCGPVACLHESVRGCRDFEEFAKRVESQRAYAQVIGEASPALPAYAQQVADRWPNARYVFVWRNAAEAGEAYARLTEPFLALDRALWQQIVALRDSHRAALADHHVLDIAFADLFTLGGMRRIWRHVASLHESAFPAARISQLVDMRISVDPNLVMRNPVVWPPPEAEPPDYLPLLRDETGSPAEAEYCRYVRTLCRTNDAAYQWFVDVIGIVKLWDHIHDGDAIHRAYALVALEHVVLGWPGNPFWKRHQKVLQSALRVAVADWKRGNATADIPAQYKGYRHLVHAIATALRRKLDHPTLDQIIQNLLASEPRWEKQKAET